MIIRQRSRHYRTVVLILTDSQTDTFAFERGFIDRVVNRENLREELTHVIRFFRRAEERG